MIGKNVVLLGSTGSIGTQTLDVIGQLASQGHDLEIVGLSAGHDSAKLREQIEDVRPQHVCVASKSDAQKLQADYPNTTVCWGNEGLLELSGLTDADLVVNAVVGSVGLPPTLSALERGKTVALANKESLAIGWHLIGAAAEMGQSRLLSIDSEHHALYQCLGSRQIEEVARLIITASGGPFLRRPRSDLANVTPEQALAHPTWTMGPRITIDSATMVNKAFEVIGAHHLFGIAMENIDVVIQPESWVHSLVEFVDGSLMAELGPRDMRIAIQGILSHPNRVPATWGRLPIEQGLQLMFEPVPNGRFPAFETVLRAAMAGGSALAAMNAGDEILIRRFLAGEIRFTDIAEGLSQLLDAWGETIGPAESTPDLQELASVDTWARNWAVQLKSSKQR